VTSDNGGRLFTATSVNSPLPGDDDVLRGTTIREVSQAVFSVSQLGVLVGHIRRPFNAVSELTSSVLLQSVLGMN
jgi:hypothetical protein